MWRGNRGKGIIGALNYLASKGMNSVYFIPYNLDGGDGKDTWPWIDPTSRTMQIEVSLPNEDGALLPGAYVQVRLPLQGAAERRRVLLHERVRGLPLAGFEVVDLGTDATPEKFVNAIKANNARLVGMSALLTTTMSNMKLVIAALKEAGVRDQVKVMIGGAPVTETYAKEIGADGYAPDAASAVDLARSLAVG